jgi:hypothetical protein
MPVLVKFADQYIGLLDVRLLEAVIFGNGYRVGALELPRTVQIAATLSAEYDLKA